MITVTLMLAVISKIKTKIKYGMTSSVPLIKKGKFIDCVIDDYLKNLS